VIEGAVQTSDEVEEASRHGFTQVLDRLAFHFVSFGVERADARSLADAVVAGVQGAMITSRALRSPDPYDAVRTMLTGYAAGVSPKTAGRRHS
jgi:hypothetical protein